MNSVNDLLAAAIAVSLYQFNVSPGLRAEKLYHHFEGQCAEPEELLALVDSKNWATGMAYQTAKAYLQHALELYSEEALEAVRINEHYLERGFKV